MTKGRIDVIILKRLLGTASGWDGDPGEYIIFYDFQPGKDIKLMVSKDLQFSEAKDTIELLDHNGDIFYTCPAVEFLSTLPRMET